MEVRRLVTALDALRSDIEDFGIKEKFAGLNSAGQSLAVSPADATANDAFIEATQVLQDALNNCRTNTAASSIRLALKEIGFDSLIGANLLRQINGVLEAKPFLIIRAAQSVKQLYTQFLQESQSLLSASSRW